ncbi:Maf family protein [Oceanimonas baumannii]|uniref:7-methyl-GTP pyrophosphatase n=1 Tax=Oceanimonas baumannii TaxID=129578 RepID=A0A235CIT3_9GAMM|nr:nucleoside triphosphate pyrophosphatase [Oceanimonas baumannii]OYD23937.1 septum formation inhibitor Maf [Oceanimonas baumannii]TDW58731.1 septum formation protein [Oceanimonas baumannii]
MPPLILASSSPYRRALLERLGVSFTCHSPDIDETPLPDETGEAMALRLAQQKAAAVAASCQSGLVVGSDQVCVNGGQLLGKPGTVENARRQLLAASGKTVTFYTGLCVHDIATGRSASLVEPFRVHFRPLTAAQIDSYLEKEPALDCAGAFKCEGLGISLFTRMEGRDPNSLVGLPLIALVELLAEFGVEVP